MRENRVLSSLVYDWPVKIITILTAVLLFFFVQFMNSESRSFILPVEYLLPEVLVVESSLPKSAEVTIEGDPQEVFSIYPDDITLIVDASGVSLPGAVNLPLILRTEEGYDQVEFSIEPQVVRIHFTEGQR